MARPKRKTQPRKTVPRTIERIAIATIAAIATSGGREGIALAAVTIFLVVVVVEELGKRWIWRGKTVTLRDMALGSVGELRLRWSASRRGGKRRIRRSRARARRSGAAVAASHAERRKVQG
jgi:hypothetical protein